MTIFVLKMFPLNKGSVGQQVVHEDLTSNIKWQSGFFVSEEKNNSEVFLFPFLSMGRAIFWDLFHY